MLQENLPPHCSFDCLVLFPLPFEFILYHPQDLHSTFSQGVVDIRSSHSDIGQYVRQISIRVCSSFICWYNCCIFSIIGISLVSFFILCFKK